MINNKQEFCVLKLNIDNNILSKSLSNDCNFYDHSFYVECKHKEVCAYLLFIRRLYYETYNKLQKGITDLNSKYPIRGLEYENENDEKNEKLEELSENLYILKKKYDKVKYKVKKF